MNRSPEVPGILGSSLASSLPFSLRFLMLFMLILPVTSTAASAVTPATITSAATPTAAPRAVPRKLAFVPAPPAHLSLVPADAAKITYRRVFKGSTPEFIEINVSEDGAATFDIRQLSDAADPQPFEIGSAIRAKIFDLAGQLHNFAGVDLDVHRRIADLGEKTLRYEKGDTVQETHFNYTINRAATLLLAIFEGLARQLQDQTALDQKLRYDRLGVNDALLHLETDLAQRTLPEPERLVPVLDRIAGDSRLIEVARQRARSLAERIRASQTAPPAP